MPNKISFFKNFGEEDFEKIMNEIILQKISSYSYQERHGDTGGDNKGDKNVKGE